MSDNTSFGDRLKWYEGRYTSDVFMPLLPVICRLDGRAFHNFTRGLDRPHDENFCRLMVNTTKFLVQETNARCGYCQSDEITLAFLTESWESEIFFGGKVQKMNSVIGSMATAYFNQQLPKFLPGKSETLPVFDNRVFQVPSEKEAANCFLWREQDATRNSIQMAARSVFSHNQCNNKNCKELQEMLFSEHNINWNDYPRCFKRGTYVRRKTTERRFTPEELSLLPPQHEARRNPDLVVKRTMIVEETFLPLTKYANRAEIILHGADPISTDSTEEQEI